MRRSLLRDVKRLVYSYFEKPSPTVWYERKQMRFYARYDGVLYRRINSKWVIVGKDNSRKVYAPKRICKTLDDALVKELMKKSFYEFG